MTSYKHISNAAMPHHELGLKNLPEGPIRAEQPRGPRSETTRSIVVRGHSAGLMTMGVDLKTKRPRASAQAVGSDSPFGGFVTRLKGRCRGKTQ